MNELPTLPPDLEFLGKTRTFTPLHRYIAGPNGEKCELRMRCENKIRFTDDKYLQLPDGTLLDGWDIQRLHEWLEDMIKNELSPHS
jgi:hypothetical protein